VHTLLQNGECGRQKSVVASRHAKAPPERHPPRKPSIHRRARRRIPTGMRTGLARDTLGGTGRRGRARRLTRVKWDARPPGPVRDRRREGGAGACVPALHLPASRARVYPGAGSVRCGGQGRALAAEVDVRNVPPRVAARRRHSYRVLLPIRPSKWPMVAPECSPTTVPPVAFPWNPLFTRAKQK